MGHHPPMEQHPPCQGTARQGTGRHHLLPVMAAMVCHRRRLLCLGMSTRQGILDTDCPRMQLHPARVGSGWLTKLGDVGCQPRLSPGLHMPCAPGVQWSSCLLHIRPVIWP